MELILFLLDRSPFFDCYKVVSKYAHCTDDACNCSSVMIDQRSVFPKFLPFLVPDLLSADRSRDIQKANETSLLTLCSCIKQNCGTDFVFNTVDSTLYCTGTATKGMSIAAEKTPSPAAPASTEATATPAPTATAGQPTTGTGTVSGTAASKPNAGERSMRVSAGGLFAVAAAAVGSLLYRL